MPDCTSEIAEIVQRYSPGDGLHPAPIPGTYCIKVSQSDRRAKRHWRAALSVVVQGAKEIFLSDRVYRHKDEPHTVATAIDLPVSSRVVLTTPAKPFLCLKIDFDPLILSEVAALLEKDFPKESDLTLRPILVEKASPQLLEATLRLGRLFSRPDDAAVLGPLVKKEILYYFLKGPAGLAIRQFVRAGSNRHRIAQAIYRLRTELDQALDVDALAKSAAMSRSAFFQHFKDVTAMSPIQYQKRLRLLEARRLMTEAGETAEGSAFKVGYNSASQFSREYSRMFGNAPLRDVVKIKRTSQLLYQM